MKTNNNNLPLDDEFDPADEAVERGSGSTFGYSTIGFIVIVAGMLIAALCGIFGLEIAVAPAIILGVDVGLLFFAIDRRVIQKQLKAPGEDAKPNVANVTECVLYMTSTTTVGRVRRVKHFYRVTVDFGDLVVRTYCRHYIAPGASVTVYTDPDRRSYFHVDETPMQYELEEEL